MAALKGIMEGGRSCVAALRSPEARAKTRDAALSAAVTKRHDADKKRARNSSRWNGPNKSEQLLTPATRLGIRRKS